jgi:predicted transcriptional regulator
MRSITIHLRADIERRLEELAERGEQTLEAYLERLAEDHAHLGIANGATAAEPHSDADEEEPRPWRGIFAPPRSRDVLFSSSISNEPEQLPKRSRSLNMNWDRTLPDDE